MMTPQGHMVGTRGEQDLLRSMNIKFLIKTFKLIPGMAKFRG